MTFGSSDIDWKAVAPVIGGIASITGAFISGYFAWRNAEIQKTSKRSDLLKLLKAELDNLQLHCELVSRDIKFIEENDVAPIKCAKYKDGGFILFDTKEIYLINPNMSQDVMQVLLYSRNNDIYISQLADDLTAKRLDKVGLNNRLEDLGWRMAMTSRMARQISDGIAAFSKKPKSYQRNKIDWKEVSPSNNS